MDKILDKDNFSKRLNRYFQITSQVGGIVTRIGANKYLGLNTDQKKNAHNLQEKFGQAKGPFMKIAQLLAMIPDAIPREYANQLMKLQTNAPPMGEYFVRRRMKNELGENWKKKFINFNETSSFAASFGQVHKAKLNNGQLVACKIQYPDMLSTVKADLVQLKVVLNLFEKFNKVIKTSKIHSEIKERLFEEIDYIKEAQNINIFNRIFKNETKINIPNIFSKYTTSKLITMSWLDGRPIHHLFTSSNNKLKEKVATNIFNAWYNKELIKILNLWASYIYGPLLDNKRRFIQGDGKKGYGFAIANKVYKKLKQIGGVEPPKEFVFIDRAAIGMGSLFMKLNVRLNWYELFNNLIKDFELNHIKKKQEEILY